MLRLFSSYCSLTKLSVTALAETEDLRSKGKGYVRGCLRNSQYYTVSLGECQFASDHCDAFLREGSVVRSNAVTHANGRAALPFRNK
jgi:hypothetical protein